MELKFTLQYSNPHVIRQVAVPEKITLQQLYQVLCVCVDMDTSGFDTLFLKNGVALEKTQQIDEVMFSESVFNESMFNESTFDSEKMLTCVVKKKNKVCWEWRIELVPKENRLSDEKTIQYPKLLRFQGTNIGNRAKEVAEYNRYSNSWYSLENLSVQQQSVNFKLKMLFDNYNTSNTPGSKKSDKASYDKLSLSQMKSCVLNLKQMKVDQMKAIEEDLNMLHPSNSVKEKRAELIAQDYAENPDFVRRVLEYMNLVEFDAFLKLYASGGVAAKSIEEYEEYETLKAYGLVSIEVKGYSIFEVCMSLELAFHAGKFMKEPEKSSLRNLQIAQAVIAACVNLYGIANYWHYNTLVDANFGKILTQEERKKYWDELVEKTKKEKQRYIWSELAKAFFKPKEDPTWIIQQMDKDFAKIPYYMPDREKIKRVQMDGTDYSTITDFDELYDVVDANCKTYVDVDELSAKMLHQCIVGEKSREIAEENKQYFIKKTIGAKEVGDVLAKIEATIRRPQYYGHTKKEFMRLTGGNTK